MKYRNTITGVIVDVPSEVTGTLWEPVEKPAPVLQKDEKKTPAKKTKKK